MSQVDAALAAIADIAALQHASLHSEVRQLRAWRELTLKGLPIKEGGRAAIGPAFPAIPESSGWYGYHECLRPGQTGTVGALEINPDTLTVSTLFTPDTQWVVSGLDGVSRLPVDRKASFYVAVKYLIPAADDQEPIAIPKGDS